MSLSKLAKIARQLERDLEVTLARIELMEDRENRIRHDLLFAKTTLERERLKSAQPKKEPS